MKKLIEELEGVFNELIEDKSTSWKFCDGINAAINIVKSHDPWIDVSEQLPPREVKGKSYTIDVITKDNFGEIWKAFYSHGRNVWYESYGENILVNTPTHWTYLPEVKP